MQGQSLGSIELGQTFHFNVSNRAADGTAIAGFTPAFYDLIDPETQAVILANQALTQVGAIAVWCGSIDTIDLPTDQDQAFEAGHTYGILVKATTTSTPTTFMLFSFSIGGAGAGAGSGSTSRLLGLQGENMLIDNMTYDSGGNCLGYRVRLFEDRASAAAATPGITDTPEPGESQTYTIVQEYSSGRTLRQWHLSLLDD